MKPLEQQLRRSRGGLIAYGGALVMAAGVFVSMGLTQLNIKYEPPEPTQPAVEYHLPPPPPPPEQPPPPEVEDISINFDLPITDGPADIALGFLDVDFGLKSKLLAASKVDVEDTIESYKTDGLDDLKVYDYDDVTEKPKRPPGRKSFTIPARAIGNTKQPVTFVVIYLVTKEGRATNVRLIDCPYPDAIPYVIKFIEGMRMTPAKKDGQKVNCLVRYQFTYRPSSGKSPFDA